MAAGEERSRADELLDDLRRRRDELRVRIHLAGAEAREEWERLEEQWERLRSRLSAAGEAAGEAREDVAGAAELLAEELKKGYRRIRDRL